MGRGHHPPKTSRGESSRRDVPNAVTMGVAPSHGITMGYVSDPFRTEEQNPTRLYSHRLQFQSFPGYVRLHIGEHRERGERFRHVLPHR